MSTIRPDVPARNPSEDRPRVAGAKESRPAAGPDPRASASASSVEITDRFESARRDESPAATYDRQGRSPRTYAHAPDAAEQIERYYEDQADRTAIRHRDEKTALADEYRDQMRKLREELDDSGTPPSELENVRRQAATAIREAREDAARERRAAGILADDYQTALKKSARANDREHQAALAELESRAESRAAERAAAERRSRGLELAPLRRQVQASSDVERQAARSRAEARAETIEEQESDWNARYRNQAAAYETERAKLVDEVDEADRAYGEKLGEALKEKDAKMGAALSAQNRDHREQLAEATRDYERSVSNIRRDADRDRAQARLALDREHARGEARRAETMERQAATYEKTIDQQRRAANAERANLERVLNAKNSTDDPGEISSAAEQAIRQLASREYEKSLQSEVNRDARARDHLQDGFRDRLGEERGAHAAETAALHRRYLADRNLDRDTFSQHIADVEEQKRIVLGAAEETDERRSAALARTQARSADETRRHYEELIASRDTENQARLSELRNTAEFERRAMRRDFQAQVAELNRTHAKELSAAKAAHQDEVREWKAKLDTTAREQDRQMKQALADQARGYERRIAENEAQAKERERVAAHNHEDELEKVKKTNALLLSKKG